MKPIYLDYQSSTPTDSSVIDKMLPYFSDFYGNPHSINHIFGKKAKEAIEESRETISKIIRSNTQELIFTSGATESNNLAVKGAYAYRSKHHGRNKILISKIEHKCVIEAANTSKLSGAEVIYIDVNKEGIIDLGQLEDSIDDNVALVSIMLANNEIGVIQPLKSISNICKKHNVWLHTDAAQAMGNMIVNVEELGIDLLSISGHKVYGPKGIGALYVRRKPRIRLTSQIDGGGQERLLRSGTLATPLIVGLGEALYLSDKNMDLNNNHNLNMRNLFCENLKSYIKEIKLNGPDLNSTNRLNNNLNFTVSGINASDLVDFLGDDVAFSTGSACSTGGIEPSYVLKAIGLTDEESMSSFRISVGRYINELEVKHASKIIYKKIQELL